MSPAIQVCRWTPLVIDFTGTCDGSVPGNSGAHIARVTSPCSLLTALTDPDVRSASAVMLNSVPEPLS
jgi:hypothetical protein